jgi:hypothetical protein
MTKGRILMWVTGSGAPNVLAQNGLQSDLRSLLPELAPSRLDFFIAVLFLPAGFGSIGQAYQ